MTSTYRASTTYSAPVCLEAMRQFRERKHQEQIKAAKRNGLVRLLVAVMGRRK